MSMNLRSAGITISSVPRIRNEVSVAKSEKNPLRLSALVVNQLKNFLIYNITSSPATDFNHVFSFCWSCILFTPENKFDAK